jgi:putative heme transporter
LISRAENAASRGAPGGKTGGACAREEVSRRDLLVREQPGHNDEEQRQDSSPADAEQCVDDGGARVEIVQLQQQQHEQPVEAGEDGAVAKLVKHASLPGGQAVSAAYWYKQLRREGADGGLAALAMIGSMVAGVLSLAGLLVVGVAAAGDHGPLAAARVAILAAGVTILVLYWVLRRRVASISAWFARRFTPEHATSVSASRRGIAAIAALAYSNWLFDCLSLYAALAAVHASVPLQGVVLTYAIAQLVASLPLLPGGGGTVEVSLVLGFAAFGHTVGSVIAGVLLFRLISCWGLVPVGWLAIALEYRQIPIWKVRRFPQPASVRAA